MFLIFYLVLMLLSVAFFTIFERKILGVIQFRMGPSKVGFMGIFQPFSDAMKLFSKITINPLMSNNILYFSTPLFFIFLSLIFFLNKPFFSNLFFSFSLLIMLFLYSLGVYTTLISGWSSNSKYSLIGSMRSIAQSLSYEITLGLLFYSVSFIFSSTLIYKILSFNFFFNSVIFLTPLLLIIMINFLIESNRTPFDLSECESELVSGFNVEFGGLEFSLIFLGENLMVIFNSLVMSILVSSIFFLPLIWTVMVFLMVLIRGSFPRLRMDLMINLCWFSFVPVITQFLITIYYIYSSNSFIFMINNFYFFTYNFSYNYYVHLFQIFKF